MKEENKTMMNLTNEQQSILLIQFKNNIPSPETQESIYDDIKNELAKCGWNNFIIDFGWNDVDRNTIYRVITKDNIVDAELSEELKFKIDEFWLPELERRRKVKEEADKWIKEHL